MNIGHFGWQLNKIPAWWKEPVRDGVYWLFSKPINKTGVGFDMLPHRLFLF